jgi:hypothetical protein
MAQKDKGTNLVVPKLETPPETTGFFQNVGAGFEAAKAGPHSTRNARAIYESRYYDQIIQALNAEGEHATDMVESPVRSDSPFYHPVAGEQKLPDGRVLIPVSRPFTNPFASGPSLTRDVNPLTNFYLGGDAAEMAQIWGAVGKVRARKPGFVAELKDPQTIDALAAQQRAAEQAEAAGVTSRATTLGKVGAFIGGMAGSVASGDPENAVGGFTSAGGEAAGKTIARQIVQRASEGAAVNAAAGLVAIPGQEADTPDQQPMSAGEIATRVAQNAVAGAVFGSAHVVIPEGVRAVGGAVAAHLPSAVRDSIIAASIRAGTVKDRDLLHEFQKTHAPYSVVDTSTPTERAAAHVLTNDVETQEQSPLQPEHAPDNNQRLSAVAKALGVDLTPPEVPPSAPLQTPTVRDQSAGPAPRRPAGFAEATIGAEGKPIRNPASTADGYGQFTENTWLSVAPRVADTTGLSRGQILQLRHDKAIAARATDYYAAQNGRYLRIRGLEDSAGNLSLAHFLGPADAAKVLKADPSTPIENIIDPKSFAANRKLLEGKSASEVIAWAHKRIGAAVEQPPARPDAVPGEAFDYTAPVPYTVENLRPDEVQTNAALMQYKSGGDEQGITDALKGVEQWNPLLSQQILAWEPNEGGRIVVDGHQRVGLAKRLFAEDDSIRLPTVVVREADGITAEQARVLGALRNIANGTGTLLDNAKVLRDAPEGVRMLPNNGPLVRDSVGLSRLSYPAFGAVVNDIISPQVAAQIGLHAAHVPESHMALVDLLRKERVNSPAEAAAITRQALADGFGTVDEKQLNLLGDTPQQSLYVPAARIMAAAAKRLKEEKRTFRVLSEKASTIEAAGNVLDRAANESKVISNDEALAILERTAHSAGPVRDALIRAARAELSGVRRADAVNNFLDELGSIDLRAAAAGVGENGGPGAAPFGQGRDVAAEAPDADLSHGSEPSLFDQAVAQRQSAEKFSDPHGTEAAQQTALLEHDLRVDAGEAPKAPEKAAGENGVNPPSGVKPPENASGAATEGAEAPVHLFDLPETGFRVSEEGERPQSIEEILKAADADEAAAQALKDCL